MFSSMAHVSLMAITLLFPIYVQAVMFSVDSFEGIAVGKPMKLTWLGNNTPVTLKLLQGRPEALEAVATIATNVAGDSYTWTPKSIPAGTYVLSITQEIETNYSPQFAIASNVSPTRNYAPAAGGTKPWTAATAGAAPPGAAGHIPRSALNAAYHPPAGYNNGSRSTCASDVSGNSTSAAFPCASSIRPNLGHYQGGVGRVDVAIGAAVVGMSFAVLMVG